MTEVGSFRIDAKGWFLTYPKCTLSKEEAWELLKQKKITIRRGCIGQEEHKDGTPHLHVYVELSSVKSVKNAHFWDLEAFHGNYQAAKSFLAVSEYVMKGGNILKINMEPQEEVESRKRHKRVLGKELIDGKELISVVEENTQLLFGYCQLKKDVEQYRMDKALSLKRSRESNMSFSTDKKRHIWLYGPSNSGKTTKLKQIIAAEGEDNCFQLPTNKDYVGYQGEMILFLDEFRGQLSVQELNRLCDGGAKMNVKGGSTIIHKYPQVIIVSNYRIDDVYHEVNAFVLESLHNRFNEEEQKIVGNK